MFTTLLITFLILGSVSMDSNLIELCSKRYFDSFVTLHSGLVTVIEVSRKIDSSSYHLWTIWMREETRGYKEFDISYKLMEGQTPSNQLTQPKSCERGMETYHGWKTVFKEPFKWIFKDFVINNDYMKGPQIKYDKTTPETIRDKNPRWIDPPHIEKTTTTLNGSRIWLTGLLCRVSDRTIYAIVETTESMNSSNRIQYLSHLRINITALSAYKIRRRTTFPYSYDFWLESMSITVIDFLGIDCPNIESTVPTTHWYSVSTKTLFVMVLVLFVSGIIFSVINVILVIKRQRQNPHIIENTSGATISTNKSGMTSSTGKSTTTTSLQKTSGRRSEQKNKKNINEKTKVSSSSEKTMDTLTLISDTD